MFDTIIKVGANFVRRINSERVMHMSLFFTKLISVISSVFILLGVVLFPDTTEGIFPQEQVKTEKQEFDEGEFVMNAYDVVVSPLGDDNNSGTLEAPLKTPEAAKEKAKSFKGKTQDAVTVWFREGTYCLEKTLEFTADDLGNVVYRSYPNETVVFSGAREISGWNITQINGVTAFAADVPIESDADYFRSLYKGSKRLSRSSYPKEGVFNVAKVEEADHLCDLSTLFNAYAAFYADTAEIKDFKNPSDVDVRIMHYWCDELLPISSVDTSTGRIETEKPAAMNISAGDNYVFENVREALSLPEEWYLDRAEQKVYYIPAEGETPENTVLYAGNLKKLVDINGVSDISFQGINFEKTNWEHVSGSLYPDQIKTDHPLYKNIKYNTNHPQAAFDIPSAININNASQINFINCEFSNISFSAVMFGVNVTNSEVRSCHFNEIGANAVYIKGERKYPATTNNITVTDCHIEKYGRISNNAIGVLLIDAADCDITHNEIHDGWYTGVSVGWVWGYTENPTNNINISHNLIYNIGNGWLSDMGGIYTLGIQPDTVISNNIIYNVGCYGGENGYGGWGIYLDEGSSGILVENNLAYDCSSQAFHQHYGKDNMIRNNIFAMSGEGTFRITRNEEHNSLFLYNNILVGDNIPVYFRTVGEDWFTDSGNLYWDYTNGGNVYSGDSMKIGERKNLVYMTALGFYNDAVFADPLFKDIENRDFTLALNSPALETGFVPWEFDAGTVTKF